MLQEGSSMRNEDLLVDFSIIRLDNIKQTYTGSLLKELNALRE